MSAGHQMAHEAPLESLQAYPSLSSKVGSQHMRDPLEDLVLCRLHQQGVYSLRMTVM